MDAEERRNLEKGEESEIASQARNDILEFEVRTWAGITQYQCTACAFDTFEKEAMLEHLVNTHNSMSALEELLGSGTSGADPLPSASPQMPEEHRNLGGENKFDASATQAAEVDDEGLKPSHLKENNDDTQNDIS
jgi:hypothetical protein